MRDAIFNSAGIPEFYGVSIQEYNEMGIGQKWNNYVWSSCLQHKLGRYIMHDHYSVAKLGTAFAV